MSEPSFAPGKHTALTGASGEYYVASQLTARGLVVGIPRAGSPGVDIIVTDPNGSKQLAIQVKTATWAHRSYKRKKEQDHFEWPVGAKAAQLVETDLYYAFVDLRLNKDGTNDPRCFIIPSETVAGIVIGGSRPMIWLPDAKAKEYEDEWNMIIKEFVIENS